MVRTLVEVREGRVTINEDDGKTTVTVEMEADQARADQRVHDLGRMAGQEDRIADLKAELARMADNFNESQKQLQAGNERLIREMKTVREQEGVLGQIKAAVISSKVQYAIDNGITRHAETLAEAVAEVRRIIRSSGE